MLHPNSLAASSIVLLTLFANSADENRILSMAWDPYQEIFQSILGCLHNDVRIGDLKPGEKKQIRGKLYLVDADVEALVRRCEKDFPTRGAKE